MTISTGKEPSDPFAAFSDDDLGAAIEGPKGATRQPPASYQTPDYTEPCRKCGGSGRFRNLGPCFACKGRGSNTFKTSPEQRARNRSGAQARKANARAAWLAEHRTEVEWLQKTAADIAQRGGTWRFPAEMLDTLARYGDLTDGKLEAVRKQMVRDAERTAQRATAKAEREANAVPVDVNIVAAAFAHAKSAARADGEGIKWLKLNLDTFTFLDMPAKGQWPAAILVKQGETKIGKIVDGKFQRFFACDDPTEARVVAAAADPAAAAKAYGLRTGTCSCCGRELTNPESRAAGIGPICAEKYGW
jgi:Family of unknown function (DUF6011)